MAIPAIIASNPRASLAVAQMLAKLGSSFLGRNDAKEAMEKAEETNRQTMARANLRQSFGGNPSVEMVQPKLDPGFGTTLLSKIGDAAGLAQTAYGLYDAKKMGDLQRQNLQGQIDRGKLTEDIARGTALGAGSNLPKETLVPPPPAYSPSPNVNDQAILDSMPEGLFPHSRGLQKNQATLDSMPSELFPHSRGAAPLSDLTGPSGAGSRMAPNSFALGGSVAPGNLSDVGQAAFSTAQNERIAASGAAQSAAQQQAFENDNALNEQFLKAKDLDLRLQIFNDKTENLGKLSQKDRMTAENKLRADFNKLTGDFRSVGDSFNTILAGADNPTAASDLSLIFAFMKMLDPRSTVRESEFAQAEQSGALPDRVQNIIGRFWDGQRLTTNRGAFLTQAKNLYDARMPAYTNILDTYTGIAGRESLDARNVVMDYKVNLDRFAEILKKSQSPVGEGVSGLGGGVDMEALRNYKPGGKVGGNILSVLGGSTLPGTGAARGIY